MEAVPSKVPEPDLFAEFLSEIGQLHETYEIVLSEVQVFEFRRVKSVGEVKEMAAKAREFGEAWAAGRIPPKLKEFADGLEETGRTIEFLDQIHTRRFSVKLVSAPQKDEEGNPLFDGEGAPLTILEEERQELTRFTKTEWLRLLREAGNVYLAIVGGVNQLGGVNTRGYEIDAMKAAKKS